MGPILAQPNPPAPPVPEANVVKGYITLINGTGTMATQVYVNQTLNDDSPMLPTATATNGRFENGTIAIGSGTQAAQTPNLRGNGLNYVETRAGVGFNIPFVIRRSGTSIASGQVVAMFGTSFTVRVTTGSLSQARAGDEFNVAGVALTVQFVSALTGNVTVQQLVVNIPFELVDDDNQTLVPDFPDTGAMEQVFDDAYILPVVDGGGNASNNSQTVAFNLNITSTVEMNQTLQNAFQSSSSRTDNYWIVWALMAYQPNPNPSQPIASNVANRADVDPDREISLVGLGTPDGNPNNPQQPGTENSGGFIFIETLREGVPQYGAGSLTLLEQATVAHELGHPWGLPDRIGGSGIMSDNFFNPAHWFLTPEDIEIIRKRVKSPGKF